MKLGETQSQ